MWNRHIYVGSVENLDLGKLKMENTQGKVTEGQNRSRGDSELWAKVEKCLWIVWEL